MSRISVVLLLPDRSQIPCPPSFWRTEIKARYRSSDFRVKYGYGWLQSLKYLSLIAHCYKKKISYGPTVIFLMCYFDVRAPSTQLDLNISTHKKILNFECASVEVRFKFKAYKRKPVTILFILGHCYIMLFILKLTISIYIYYTTFCPQLRPRVYRLLKITEQPCRISFKSVPRLNL